MVNTRFRRREEARGPSRLETVQHEARKKALFWDRTSISSFLGAFAFLGIFVMLIGLYGLSNGELRIGHYFQLTYATSEWRYTTICMNLVVLGLNLMMPMPMFWTMSERRTVIICASILGVNFLVFMYAFIIDVIAQSDLFFF